jgi:hypothetical protein
MVPPDVPAAVFEGEAELAVVIGKRASRVPAARAMDHVFGYANFVDGSARGLKPERNSSFQMKSRATFAPIGPWIVTKDEVADQQDLAAHQHSGGRRPAGSATERCLRRRLPVAGTVFEGSPPDTRFAWLGRNRRSAKDLEGTIAPAAALLYAASVVLLTRRLARSARVQSRISG